MWRLDSAFCPYPMHLPVYPQMMATGFKFRTKKKETLKTKFCCVSIPEPRTDPFLAHAKKKKKKKKKKKDFLMLLFKLRRMSVFLKSIFHIHLSISV